jgi:hypothetical protein
MERQQGINLRHLIPPPQSPLLSECRWPLTTATCPLQIECAIHRSLFKSCLDDELKPPSIIQDALPISFHAYFHSSTRPLLQPPHDFDHDGIQAPISQLFKHPSQLSDQAHTTLTFAQWQTHSVVTAVLPRNSRSNNGSSRCPFARATGRRRRS